MLRRNKIPQTDSPWLSCYEVNSSFYHFASVMIVKVIVGKNDLKMLLSVNKLLPFLFPLSLLGFGVIFPVP